MTAARDVFRVAGSPPQEGCEDDVACDATTRYVLEAASRGLGLGSRVAYGCGRVEVTTLAR